MTSSNDARSSSQGNIETNRGAMPAFQARALQTLHVQLMKELHFDHVIDQSLSIGLIVPYQMDELSGMTRRKGTRAFLENLQQSGPNGYQKFLEVLQTTGYVDLKLKIEETLSKQFPTNINIVLIGKTGVGKSRLGNSLLRQPAAFYSKPSFGSVTKVCSLQSNKKSHHGKEVTVNIIDSPGLADSNTSTNDIIREIANCMGLARGRVDVFIVVINAADRMTDEGKAPIHMLKDRYGVESEKFVLIVFTHTDQIPDETNLKDLIEENTFLRETISLFNNRYGSFGINSVDHDVEEIFNRIFTMIEENYDTYYSHCLFEEAKKNFDDRMKRLEEEQKMKDDKKVQKLRDELEQKIRDELEQKLRDELTKEIEDKLRIEFEERHRKTPVASQSLKEEQKRKEEELKQKLKDELTKEIGDKLRMEYEERYRNNPIAFSSLREEMRMEKFKRKVKDELTKEIEDKFRIEFEERYRKAPVGKASASSGMQETDIVKPVLKIDDKIKKYPGERKLVRSKDFSTTKPTAPTTR